MSWNWEDWCSGISTTGAATDMPSRGDPRVKYENLVEPPVAYRVKAPKRKPPREK